MWLHLAAGTQYITIKSQEWNFGAKSQKKYKKSQKSFLQPTITTSNIYSCLWSVLIHVFLTNKYADTECLFIHGIPEAIRKMLATENYADGW